MTDKISIEWTVNKDGRAALVFDAKSWAAFERAANTQGKTAQQIITAAVVGVLGTVLMDNYR